MSEPTTEPTTEPTAETEAPVDGAVEQPEAPETFSREYVTELRAEAAQHRTRAGELSDALLTRCIELATDGILYDPTDLPKSDALIGEDGMPDLLAIRMKAEELAAAKPHLAKPRGTIGQGVQEAAPQPRTLLEFAQQRLG